ncbi:divergent PAP2 family protein [Undibacterium sp. TJN19]|uniref:divergent PAP2 family protein n=1 Tax=Undibacterium sp. TJN19 TaxID=3413055 RepID=UPI003BF42AB2
MNFSYLLTPFTAWLVAGSIKFAINSIKARKLAFSLIGYGGLPSNHSAIVSSMVTLIGMKEGIAHPAFGVSVTLAFIVILDANSLRRQIGKHAEAINRLNDSGDQKLLRERVGHSRFEIVAGILTGVAVAAAIKLILG